ncbi:hypothetical protein GGR58DRAFT_491914 [Xylaria digitata]|nr:hypothetical protein GGR58DRAFT_491914 [Xylaria digitata]
MPKRPTRAISVAATTFCSVSCLRRLHRYHTEAYNRSRAKSKLDRVLDAKKNLQTMLVLDADKMLTAEDMGELFGRSLFMTASPQAILMYEETADENKFDVLCTAVASVVNIHPYIRASFRTLVPAFNEFMYAGDDGSSLKHLRYNFL